MAARLRHVFWAIIISREILTPDNLWELSAHDSPSDIHLYSNFPLQKATQSKAIECIRTRSRVLRIICRIGRSPPMRKTDGGAKMTQTVEPNYWRGVVNRAILGAVVGIGIGLLSSYCMFISISNSFIFAGTCGLLLAIFAGVFGDRFWDFFFKWWNRLLKWWW